MANKLLPVQVEIASITDATSSIISPEVIEAFAKAGGDFGEAIPFWYVRHSSISSLKGRCGPIDSCLSRSAVKDPSSLSGYLWRQNNFHIRIRIRSRREMDHLLALTLPAFFALEQHSSKMEQPIPPITTKTCAGLQRVKSSLGVSSTISVRIG
jgi:hypothetical protein